MNLPLRASNEHIPIVRVPRAQKIISLHPLLFRLPARLGLRAFFSSSPSLPYCAMPGKQPKSPRVAGVVRRRRKPEHASTGLAATELQAAAPPNDVAELHRAIESKEPRPSRLGFCKPRGNLPPLRYGLPFLPALPSGASWQIFVMEGRSLRSIGNPMVGVG